MGFSGSVSVVHKKYLMYTQKTPQHWGCLYIIFNYYSISIFVPSSVTGHRYICAVICHRSMIYLCRYLWHDKEHNCLFFCMAFTFSVSITATTKKLPGYSCSVSVVHKKYLMYRKPQNTAHHIVSQYLCRHLWHDKEHKLSQERAVRTEFEYQLFYNPDTLLSWWKL